MIVEHSKAEEVKEGNMHVELPPPYASSSASDQAPSTSTAPYAQPPPLPRQNHLSIKRASGQLKGTWIIDPELKLPEAVLAPLQPNEVRKNLELVSDFGAINAEVWIVRKDRSRESEEYGGGKTENVWPATVTVMGKNGAVKVRMNADESHPFKLVVTSNFGKVTIGLPRTFVGPLTATTRFGSLCLSGSVKPQVATFSDVNNTFKGFLGDVESTGFGNGDWEGSRVEVDCLNGSVNIYYLDELDEHNAAKKNQPGFWARMFGKDTQPSPDVASVR